MATPINDTDVLIEGETEVRPPPLFKVMLHNDDYTTMEFVVLVLCSIFHKKPEDAVGIMLQIHKNGTGVCGVYTGDEAETKIAAVHARAQDEGFPLRCSMEPA